MIDVVQQINAVRRQVGARVLEAGEARTVTISQSYGAADRRRVGRRHQPRADPALVSPRLG